MVGYEVGIQRGKESNFTGLKRRFVCSWPRCKIALDLQHPKAESSNRMKRILRWMVGGTLGIAGSYWLLRYLRPRHSALAFDGAVALIADATSPIGQALTMALAKRGARLALSGPDADTLDSLRQ